MNSPFNPLDYLDYVQFYPTLRCNWSCNFCFNQNIRYEVEDITVQSFNAMIEKLKCETPVETIDIIGGEPFLYDRLYEIIESAIKERFRLNISTNGSLKERILDIAQKFKEIRIGISINSPGKLLDLLDMIYTLKPIVKSLYRKDMNNRMVKVLCGTGLEYYLIYPDEMGHQRRNHMVGFKEFYDFIRSTDAAHFSGPVYCSGFLPDLNRYPILEYLRCPAGTVKIGILPDGDVYPCNLFFGFKEFYLGNIFRDQVKDILRHPLLDFFRNYNGNRCPKRDCYLHNQCHGGCPAHAYSFFHRLDAPEPRCLYER